MKKIVISGCNGFVGSSLVRKYLHKGFNVIGIDINDTKIIDKNFTYKKINLVKDNIDNIINSIDIDVFIHCAGNANVAYSIENPKMDFQSNVESLNNVLVSLKQNNKKCKFIFLSSAAVYGDPTNSPINENEQIKPISPYGLHKSMCEDMCKYYRKVNNMDVVVVRIFSAYGVGLKKQIFWDMYNKFKKYGVLELFGTGNETRDFINIKDVVNAIVCIVENNSQNYIYNIANGEEIEIQKIAKIFANEIADESIVKFNGITKVGDPFRWRADISKILDLGYVKTVNIEDGIREYIKWVKEF